MKINQFLNTKGFCSLLLIVIVMMTSYAQEIVALDSIKSNEIQDVKLQVDAVASTNNEIEIILNERKFEDNFKSKYDESSFEYEATFKNKSSWWTRLKEKLAHFFRNIFSFNNEVDSLNFVDYFIKTIAVVIILVVVFLITKSILNKEGQWIFGKSSTKSVLQFEDVEKNIHRIDFEKLIQETLAKGEERLVIRYYYLWILRTLSDQKLIAWDAEKTNSDYLYEIKDNQIRENYAYLSYLYNNIWYGEFEINQSIFENAKKSFEKTLKIIQR